MKHRILSLLGLIPVKGDPVKYPKLSRYQLVILESGFIDHTVYPDGWVVVTDSKLLSTQVRQFNNTFVNNIDNILHKR